MVSRAAAVFAAPVILAIIVRQVDYNLFISTPYWAGFCYCYLSEAFGVEKWALSSICSGEAQEASTQWLVDHWRWDLEGVAPDSDVHIPEIAAEDFSFEAMAKATRGFTMPAVVRGLAAGTKATQKWSPEFFEENYGDDILITLMEGRVDAQYAGSEKTMAQGSVVSKGDGYQKVMQTVKMKLRNSIHRMKQGQRLYIANIDTIFRRNNDLLDDLELPARISPWSYGEYTPFATQMFFGYGSDDRGDTTGTMFHSASSANFFVQVVGNKTWSFISPRYSALIRPSLGLNLPAAKLRTAPVNVPRTHVTLQPGDVMFNPPWQWHEIHNGLGFTVGVATRENHPIWIARNNMLFSGLLEFCATPRTARLVVPSSKPVMRVVASVPFLTFSLSYLMESVRGIQKHPMYTAAYNPCDEHDKTGQGCTETLLDKAVYSSDAFEIPYLE